MNKLRGLLVAVVLLVMGAPGALAAGGVAELRLDGAALREILGAALPEPTTIEVPGIGEIAATLGPVRRVRFVDGGVEAEVTLGIERIGITEIVGVRFVPDVERRTGTARLVPEVATVPGLPFEIDLEGWVRPAELPRSVTWELEMPGARPLPVRAFVQGIEVEEDRLRIDLGLVGGGRAGATPIDRHAAGR